MPLKETHMGVNTKTYELLESQRIPLVINYPFLGKEILDIIM